MQRNHRSWKPRTVTLVTIIGISTLVTILETGAYLHRDHPAVLAQTVTQEQLNSVKLNGIALNGIALNSQSSNRLSHHNPDWIQPDQTIAAVSEQPVQTILAGIDFGLALMAQLAGKDVALASQLEIEYAPEPPFDSGTPDTAKPEIRRAVLDKYTAFAGAFKEMAGV